MSTMIRQDPPRLRVQLRGAAGWWWVCMVDGRPDVTKDARLASELLDVGVEGIVLRGLRSRRARHNLEPVTSWELVDQAGEVLRAGNLTHST